MYELTMFRNQFDNKTHNRLAFKTWEQFVSWLYKVSKLPGKKGGSDSSPLISPAVYREGTTRSNKNATHWGEWCALDVDEHELPNDLESLKQELQNRFGQYDYVVYSTASNSLDKAKFRIVFRLDEAVEQERIKAFWYAINNEVGELGDPQTKDVSRMFFVPAQYPDSNPFIFSNSGSPIDVSALIAKHPYVEKTGNSFLDRLPPEMQKAVIEHRKQSMNNTNIYWSDYTDCPFFPKQLALEYKTISKTGWYHKMYQIMVATAGNAINRGYPITSKQIADLCGQLDRDTGNWYNNRPLELEADRAVEYAYRNN